MLYPFYCFGVVSVEMVLYFYYLFLNKYFSIISDNKNTEKTQPHTNYTIIASLKINNISLISVSSKCSKIVVSNPINFFLYNCWNQNPNKAHILLLVDMFLKSYIYRFLLPSLSHVFVEESGQCGFLLITLLWCSLTGSSVFYVSYKLNLQA